MIPVKQKTLSMDARRALSRAVLTDDLLVLPDQLDRPVYIEVNKALENFGAKWNRGRKGHVLPSCAMHQARDYIDAAVDSGVFFVAVDDFFPTPRPIAQLLASCVKEGDAVLEPSAGDGALLRCILSRVGAQGTINACECVRARAQGLRAEFGQTVVVSEADFLSLWPVSRFNAVVMNPPFSKRADLHHVARAMEWLLPGGQIAAVLGAGVLFRQDALTLRFNKWLFEHALDVYGADIDGWSDELAAAGVEPAFNEGYTSLGAGAFASSGTNVSTVVLRGQRRKAELEPFVF